MDHYATPHGVMLFSSSTIVPQSNCMIDLIYDGFWFGFLIVFWNRSFTILRLESTHLDYMSPSLGQTEDNLTFQL